MDIRWTPGIGDPNFLGWLTVIAYFAAAAMCRRAASKANTLSAERNQPRRIERRFWKSALLILVLLGINKQLDLQSLLTEIGRAAARSEGWYDQRRSYQLAFVELLAFAAVATGLGLVWLSRGTASAVKLGSFGLTFTGFFVVARAASFHHVDALLGARVLGLRANSVIELTGITIVAAAAWLYHSREWQSDPEA